MGNKFPKRCPELDHMVEGRVKLMWLDNTKDDIRVTGMTNLRATKKITFSIVTHKNRIKTSHAGWQTIN
jgi:hypothetical protein